MSDLIYLDNNTITRPSSQAVEKMLPFLKERWGAVESPHKMGQEQLPAVDAAASAIYEALGAGFDDRFHFTSSGAEAIGQIFFSLYLDQIRETGHNHFLTTAVEETAVLMATKRLQKVDCFAKMLPVDPAGRLRAEVLEEAIRPRACMLSISMANSLTGVLQPVADLARICKEKEILLHVDVSSALGKIFFSFQDFGIDLLSFEGSLLHAPRGTGGLLVRKGLEFSPVMQGAAPFNSPLFIALAVAMDELQERVDHMCTEVSRLRQKFEDEIEKAYPDAIIFFRDVERLPNTSVIAFPGAASEAMLFKLNRRGVFATFGGKSSQHLSHILKACGIDSEQSLCALSFSLSHETTEDQIDRAVEIIVETAKELRAVAGALL